MATTEKLPDPQELVLEMLQEHGPRRFTGAIDLTACGLLYDAGYITDHGTTGAKKLTRKGLSYLRAQ